MIGRHEALDRASLLHLGISRRALGRAVASGSIIRLRRDRYVSEQAPTCLQEAVRVGGRLTCLSLLQLLTVFIFDNTRLHVHIRRGSSRLRSPEDRFRPLRAGRLGRTRLHWMALTRPDEGTGACVHIVDALVHSVLCQPARHAIATLDSALNLGLISEAGLAEVFAALPTRFRALQPFIDGQAESGPETLVRLMVRFLGCSVRLQVEFAGIGRVDLLVDGWLVVECDSKAFHAKWEQQVEDRRRDRALAARGYATLRLTAAEIMYQPGLVMAALRGLVELPFAAAPRSVRSDSNPTFEDTAAPESPAMDVSQLSLSQRARPGRPRNPAPVEGPVRGGG